MATIGFGICLVISILALLHMAFKNYDNIDIYYWTIILLNPIIILAYWLKTRVTTPEAARLAFCFTNLDGAVLLMLYVFAMLHGLGIRPKLWSKIVGYGVAFLHLAIIWLCFDNDLYYKTMTVIDTGNGFATKMESGILKPFHLIYILGIAITVITIIIIGYIKQGCYSRRMVTIYTSLTCAGLIIYFLEIMADVDFSLLPYLYTVITVFLAYDYDYVHGHDISSLVSMHQSQASAHGYLSLGMNKVLLGYNEACLNYLPFLKDQRVDAPLDPQNPEVDVLMKLVNDFKQGKASSAEFMAGDMICKCDISYFAVRKNGKKQGFLIDIRDATEETHNLEILTNYNDMLNEEVAQKTNHIGDIQRKIVLGMADMIENRDNNTGGHVKRTSDIISIIVDEINRQNQIELDEQLAVDIVRAAPTHDLGKLQIDSNILCKPGRLTDEEFATMKSHATISGEMVMILLDGVEEEHFVTTSFNIARYHHERWDGKGYPEGLVGSMIPLEARIMAVADVYDALVSKRCYKEPMSFEEAASIMCKNMGSQFDPSMKAVFLGCRSKLEDYYSSSDMT